MRGAAAAAAPHLALPVCVCVCVCGCVACYMLLICGLGVEDQAIGACEVPDVLHVISFCGIGPKTKFTDQDQEPLINWSNKNWR